LTFFLYGITIEKITIKTKEALFKMVTREMVLSLIRIIEGRIAREKGEGPFFVLRHHPMNAL